MDKISDLLVFLIVTFAVMIPTVNNPLFAIIAVTIILTLVILFSLRNAVVRT